MKDDIQSRVRKAAAEALENIGFQPRDDTEKAYLLIAKEKWEEVAQLGEPAVEPLIREVKRLGHPEPAKALTKIGEPALEHLIQLLEHQAGFVRIKAVTALGDIGDARAVEPLTNVALNDADDSIRSAANEALKKIEIGKM
jgi:HEAT repeat protein